MSKSGARLVRAKMGEIPDFDTCMSHDIEWNLLAIVEGP